MRPKTKTEKISREELESIQIPPGSNVVIVHVPHKNEDTVTTSGIYIVADQDFKPAEHAERWGYIYKLPPSLVFERGNPNTMSWKTEIEVEIGDKVWFDFRQALYATTYVVDGEWYKVMDYEFLHLAYREDDDTVIPLNGYLLMREYRPPKESDLLLDPDVDKQYAVVVKAGSKNKEYILDFWNDDIDVCDGDHVMFEVKTSCFPLEAQLHREFGDDKYILQQRKRVIAVVNEKHNKVLRLHKGIFAIKEREEVLEKSGIVLVRPQRKMRVADVIESNNDAIPAGSVVVVSKQRGSEFKELEYFTEDKVYYYETT